MKLLLIESTPGNADEIGTRLVAEGHKVVTCTDEHGGPCRGIQHHVECPLQHHVDLAILTREPGAAHTIAEMGSVCATRHRVPLVEVAPTNVADDLPSVAVAAAVATRAVEAGYATAIRHELPHIAALVHVSRTAGRVHASVQIPEDLGSAVQVAAVADRARHAVRTHDPFVRNIDVSVSCYPSPDPDQL